MSEYYYESPPFDPPYMKRMRYSHTIDQRMIDDDPIHLERLKDNIWRNLQIKAIDDPFISHLKLIEYRYMENVINPIESILIIDYYECYDNQSMHTAKVIVQ